MIINEYQIAQVAKAYGELLLKTEDEWSFYYTAQDMIDVLFQPNVYVSVHSSCDNVRAMFIFQVQEFPTGNVQLDVLWSSGEEIESSFQTGYKDMMEVANKCGAKRLRMFGCRCFAKYLHKECGFELKSLGALKDL